MLTIAWIRKELLWPQALGMLVMCSKVLSVTGCTLSFVNILSVLWIYAYYDVRCAHYPTQESVPRSSPAQTVDGNLTVRAPFLIWRFSHNGCDPEGSNYFLKINLKYLCNILFSFKSKPFFVCKTQNEQNDLLDSAV
jgi:hypothetical protein